MGRIFCCFFLLGFVGLSSADTLWRNVEEENFNELDKETLESIFSDLEELEEEDEIVDPCVNVHCGAGKVCLIDKVGKGYCSCLDFCMQTGDERRKVCSNHNETWDSDCSLYRMRCLCQEESEECDNKDWAYAHIEYYGSCQVVPKCEEEDMDDFPRRMTEWLFNIMRDMADRRELTARALQLEKEAEEDYNRRWTNAAVWKWCQLDHGPRDRVVSRHELFPLRAPLHTLEYCISPFLDGCDKNIDHKISLEEWTQCLKLSAENFDELEELCDEITAE